MDHLSLLKLCVGVDKVQQLADWQASRRAETGANWHVTRMWPRRADEILGGGALYWVIKGTVLVRQSITGFEERRGEDGIRRCAILLAPDLIRTEPQPRRAFQGWRYLEPANAPRDLGPWRAEGGELPEKMELDLARLGVL